MLRTTVCKQIAGIILILFLLISCQEQPAPPPSPTTNQTPFAQSTHAATKIFPTLSPTNTSPPPASATPFLDVTTTPTNVPTDLSVESANILIYPSGNIFDGETITVQVWAHVPAHLHPNRVAVQLKIDEEVIQETTLSRRMLGGDTIGAMTIFPWVWDTTNSAGTHTISISLDPNNTLLDGDENPNNNIASKTITVQPKSQMPAGNPSWITIENNCCQVHVTKNSTAHRDLATLLPLIDQAVASTSQQLTTTPPDNINIFLIERVIGQGGYTSGNNMVVSYLDRQYTGDNFYELLVHESTHVIDVGFAPSRIGFLAEGVAVWATGGHYKPENLTQRTAALVQSGQYIPLATLVNNFIASQHEIGYLQAGGFVEYLVNKYGWEATKAFYADTSQNDAGTLAQALDLNLQHHFNQTLAQTEQEWLTTLQTLPLDQAIVQDVNSTIHYYDTMRFYQQLYDPSAHFKLAWFPPAPELQQRNDTASLSRHPETERNILLEVMLQDADNALRSGNYHRANIILDAVDRTLAHNGNLLDPLAINYYEIIHELVAKGYFVHQVNLHGSQASVKVTRPTNPTLSTLQMVLNNQTWILTQ